MSATVRDLMSTKVASIAPTTSFKDIARMMLSAEVTALPVVADGSVVGIVTETDLLHKEEFKREGSQEDYEPPLRTRIRRVLGGSGSGRRKAAAVDARGLMNREVITVLAGDSAISAVRAMERRDVKQLPVVDESGALVGMVSRRDLLRIFARPDEDIARDIGIALAQTPRWLNAGALTFAVQDGIATLEGTLEQHSSVVLVNQMVHGVDGVVGVSSNITWEVDDLLPPRARVR
ncbi:CBS domain-containing protein [Lipingzhangella sp. LS1_29]|uniref:CBS domain-containing protein n=1 Tax=Lipingzhangella rawalii TaxID=2055835 RepID=A0ABU2HAR9_9ACTN|nr:CBS domain-containing protein [Lipingzhangella rawalii]MDS1272376.1 CBS domain-containing protein [Lipingzhangella rawalii]